MDSYKYMGNHKATHNGKEGISFMVWAPNAKEIELVGILMIGMEVLIN